MSVLCFLGERDERVATFLRGVVGARLGGDAAPPVFFSPPPTGFVALGCCRERAGDAALVEGIAGVYIGAILFLGVSRVASAKPDGLYLSVGDAWACPAAR